MSTQHFSSTPPSVPPRPRGPERFAAPSPEPARRSPFAALGAFVVLLALVVGVPVGLWLWQGSPPVPTGLPSREDLTRPLTFDALVVVLLAVVWLAWLQFTACVLVEVAALLRGGGLPRPVPFSGRSQALARVLVGTVLVGAAVVGTTGPAAAGGIAHDPAGGTSVARDAGTPVLITPTDSRSEAVEQVPSRGGMLDDALPSLVDGLREGLGAVASGLAGQKVVVVQPPEGRYHHNLWDIAEEHLGDGRRWKEIFELNKGRPQPDGGELVIGRLIQPGWVLSMPGDAVGTTRLDAGGDDRGGVDRTMDTGDRSDRIEHVVEEVGDWTGPWDVDEAGDDVAVVPGDTGDAADASATEETAPDGGDPAALPWELVGGGLLTAALAGALAAERRRRRGRDLTAAEADTEVALLIGADSERAERLDRALRRLVVTCRAAGLSLPPVYAATVSEEAIELRIAPAALPAPAPWTPMDEGRRWRLDRIASDSDRGKLGNAPYPGLVCLGRDARGADVLIDLEAVGGPASITGSDAVAREVVAALAVQLVTSPWSDEQRVHAHHLSPVLADIADRSLSTVDDLAALVAELEAAHPHADGGDVLARRAAGRAGLAPQYLFLGTAPDERLFERLQPMIRSGDRGIGVVAVGRLPGTRWQLRVDDAGHLTLPLLDLDVTAVRLSERTVDQLAALFGKARERRALTTVTELTVPGAPRTADDAYWATAPVRIGVLGQVEPRVPAPIDPDRLALATEVVAFLALQQSPVHPTVLAASIWPRGVTAEVRDATIGRVREWLGTAVDGSYLLRETGDGRLFLADEVAVDWHAFCTLVQRAQGATPPIEAELLRRALQLVRGPLFDGREPGHYTWLPRTGLEGVVSDAVEGAATRLVRLSAGDPAGAAAAARAGLRLVPRSQTLWRHLLRAEYDDGGEPALSGAADQMGIALSWCGADLEPETVALLEELKPGAGARTSRV